MFSANSSQSGDGPLYVEDVFQATLYTGTGNNQTITNGVDLAGRGGLVIIKDRSDSFYNRWIDTVRGSGLSLTSNLLNSNGTGWTWTANSNGFSIGAFDNSWNRNGAPFVSWTFRRAPKFFDVVSWTGDGTSLRQIPHNLGVVPGCIIVKRTDANGTSWYVWHRNYTQNGLYINSQTIGTGDLPGFATSQSLGTINLANNTILNVGAATYIAYVFAHDTSADGIIQCGSYSGANSYGQATFNGNATGYYTIPAGITSVSLTVRGGTGTYTPPQPDTRTYALWYGIDHAFSNSVDLYYYQEAQDYAYQVAYYGWEGFNNDIGQYLSGYYEPSGPSLYYLKANGTIWGYGFVSSTRNTSVQTGGSPAQPAQYTTGGTSFVDLNGTRYSSAGGYGTTGNVTAWNINLGSNPSGMSAYYDLPTGGYATFSYGTANTTTVTLGWQPQFLLIKNITANSDWQILDTKRGLTTSNTVASLTLNLANAESSIPGIRLTSTGFVADTPTGSNQFTWNGNTYIYIAIRNGPMKP